MSIINGITNDSKNEQEIEFVDKKTSHRRMNEASVNRTTIKEHRAALGLVNPIENVSDMEKDKKSCSLILRYAVFLNREHERKAVMEPDVEHNEESEKWKAALPEKRFNVVPICNIQSHFVAIDSSVLHDIMKRISTEFDIRREEFIGENP